jgi:hypothetical protein
MRVKSACLNGIQTVEVDERELTPGPVNGPTRK